MDFIFIFLSSKIHVSPTGIVSSLFPPQCHLSSGQHRHAATSCHVSFPLSQDVLATFASSSGNTLPCCLPSRVKTEALNQHHCRRLSSPNHSTPTLNCYKKIISTLVTLPITQPRLYFASQITTPLELHPPPSFNFTAVSCSFSLRTMASTVTN
jgi:hypothetical protein